MYTQIQSTQYDQHQLTQTHLSIALSMHSAITTKLRVLEASGRTPTLPIHEQLNHNRFET